MEKVYTVKVQVSAESGKYDYGTVQYEVELPKGDDQTIFEALASVLNQKDKIAYA